MLPDYFSNLILSKNSPSTPRGAPPAKMCPSKKGRLSAMLLQLQLP